MSSESRYLGYTALRLTDETWKALDIAETLVLNIPILRNTKTKLQ